MELERGVELLIGLEAISDPDERGMRTVMCILNGQLRPILVRDRSIASSVPAAEKADRSNPDHIAAPFAGVVTVAVSEDDEVIAGQTVATIEAMKMEAAITAPKAGRVEPDRGVGDGAGGGRRSADGGQLTRIIAGRARRPAHRRSAPRGPGPTSDRVREALFNVLAARLDFAGMTCSTSTRGPARWGSRHCRGAARATFVEANPSNGRGDRTQCRDARADGATVLARPVAAVLGRRADASSTWCWPTRRTTRPSTEVNAMLAALARAAGRRRGRWWRWNGAVVAAADVARRLARLAASAVTATPG